MKQDCWKTRKITQNGPKHRQTEQVLKPCAQNSNGTACPQAKMWESQEQQQWLSREAGGLRSSRESSTGLSENGEEKSDLWFLMCSVKYEIAHLLQAKRDYMNGIPAIIITDSCS